MTNRQLITTEPALTPTQFNQLHTELKKFSDLYKAWRRPDHGSHTLAEYRAAADGLPALRRRFEEIDRPASPRLIAAEIAKLTIAFPNSTGADSDLFAQMIADDVQADHPSYYALATAAFNYRRKYKFLGISDLVAELERAQWRGKWLRCSFDEFPSAERLNQVEAERDLLKEREEEGPWEQE
jgi:hypothetical protein